MKNSRSFIHIHGQQEWCAGIAHKILSDHFNFNQFEIICCGIENDFLGSEKTTYIDNTKKRSEIENHLGTEYSALIFNCFNGFNPGLFCALIGLVKSPGIIILMTPEIQQWPDYADPDYARFCSYPYTSQDVKGRYITYLIRKLTEQSKSKYFFTLAHNFSSKEKLNIIKTISYSTLKENTLVDSKHIIPNQKQQEVINAIEKLVAIEIQGIIAVYGDRGRGKSTVIGVALRHIAQTSDIPGLKVNVVAQNKKNITPIFEQLTEIESDTRNSFSINFVPPDEFLRSKPDCNLLVIEEAAAIPLAVLKRLVELAPKLIISSTLDGYEGTGMGLWTKFQTYLSSINRSVDIFELTLPQRWAKNDPVENFIFNTFLLKKKKSSGKHVLTVVQNINQINIEKIDRDILSHDAEKTYQIFQLLTHAHYRTTPDDLRYILDAPDIELWVAIIENKICGVLMVCNEGAIIDNTLERDIWLSKRRVNGHLIPQTLSSQSGFRQATDFSYKRIVRIAVEQKHRRKGIASKLQDILFDSVAKGNQNIDFIAVSYGFEPFLLEFWRALAFKSVRISHRENTRSGFKSMIMLKPISTRAYDFCDLLVTNFKQDLKFSIAHTKDKNLNYRIINIDDLDTPSKNHQQNQLDIYTFVFGNRQYLNCRRALYEFGMRCLNTRTLRNRLTQRQIDLITFTVLQNMNWARLKKLLVLDGKKQIIRELRTTYCVLYNAVWGNKS